MPTLEERIAGLEAEIAHIQQANANWATDANVMALITSSRATLTALLNQQQQGNAISLYSFISNSLF